MESLPPSNSVPEYGMGESSSILFCDCRWNNIFNNFNRFIQNRSVPDCDNPSACGLHNINNSGDLVCWGPIGFGIREIKVKCLN